MTRAIPQPGPGAIDHKPAMEILREKIRGASETTLSVEQVEREVIRAITGRGIHAELWHTLRMHATDSEEASPDAESAG
jgi:hypothetical protein